MTITLRRRVSSAALALLLPGGAIALAPPATAVVEWGPATFAADTGMPNSVAVVTDDQGDAWVLVNRSGDTQLAEHPADGGEPRVQTLPGYGGRGVLVIDSLNRITLAYNSYDGLGGASVMARAIAPDGTIGPAQEVSNTAYFPDWPRAAVAPDGVVSVAWTEIDAERDGTSSRVRMARLEPATAAPLGPPITLDEPRTTLSAMAQIAGDDDGEMTVAWVRRDLDFGPTTKPPGIFAARIDALGFPGELRRVSPPGMGIVGEVGDVVVGPKDAATMVWTADTGPRSTWAARLPADGGAVTDRVRVSEPDEPSAGAPAATVDPRGRVTVVWARRSTPPGVGVQYVENRRLSASGEPQQVRPLLGALDRTGASDTLGVVADTEGFVTVVWPARDAQTYSSYASRIHAVRLDPRGRPSSEHRLERDLGWHGHSLGVALAPDDSVVAAWLDSAGARIARSAPSGAPLVPADTAFLRPPEDPTSDRRPKVVLYSSAVDATFECRIDGGRWRPCEWSARLPRLSYGEHRLAVRATDVDGTDADPTPAVATFRVVRD